MANQKTLSENIMDYLLKQGLSQSQVSRILGVGRSFISHVAHGQRQMTFDHLEKLATGLDMTVPELLARSTPPSSVPLRQRKRYRLFLHGLTASVNLQKHLPELTKSKRKQAIVA